MDCAECASHVQKAIASVEGVKEADVLLGAEKAIVRFDVQALDIDPIRRAVKEAGYEVAGDREAEAASRGKDLTRKILTLFGAAVVFFMRLGEYAERFTAEKARGPIRGLESMAPQQARLERIPVDGVVLSGQATIDQSAITGESMPIEVAPGARVFAATIPQLGSLRVRTERVGSESTFGKVILLPSPGGPHRRRDLCAKGGRHGYRCGSGGRLLLLLRVGHAHRHSGFRRRGGPERAPGEGRQVHRNLGQGIGAPGGQDRDADPGKAPGPRDCARSPGDNRGRLAAGFVEVRKAGAAAPGAVTIPGATVVAVSCDGVEVGRISLSDEVRPEVPRALAAVRELGIRRIELLTGDNEETGRRLAQELGVDYQAELLSVDQRTMRVVRRNIWFTGIYNLAGLTLAALGILPPVLAAAAQSLPDLGILANSCRLLRQRSRYR
jgi:cation transport ATPase